MKVEKKIKFVFQLQGFGVFIWQVGGDGSLDNLFCEEIIREKLQDLIICKQEVRRYSRFVFRGVRVGGRFVYKGGKLSFQYCKMGLKIFGVNSFKCWNFLLFFLEELLREVGVEIRKSFLNLGQFYVLQRLFQYLGQFLIYFRVLGSIRSVESFR